MSEETDIPLVRLPGFLLVASGVMLLLLVLILAYLIRNYQVTFVDRLLLGLVSFLLLACGGYSAMALFKRDSAGRVRLARWAALFFVLALIVVEVVVLSLLSAF